jgi:Flp pilus assembly protein TadB
MSNLGEARESDMEARVSSSSVGDLLGEVSRDFSKLMRQEVQLAKAELRESATKAGRGAGMLTGAGVAGYTALLFLTIALWIALGTLVGLGWAAVIIAVVYAVVALVLFVVGRNQLKTIEGMPQTADTVKQIPEALKP